MKLIAFITDTTPPEEEKDKKDKKGASRAGKKKKGDDDGENIRSENSMKFPSFQSRKPINERGDLMVKLMKLLSYQSCKPKKREFMHSIDIGNIRLDNSMEFPSYQSCKPINEKVDVPYRYWEYQIRKFNEISLIPKR